MQQPEGSKLDGQAVVAMLLGQSLDAVCAALGTKRLSGRRIGIFLRANDVRVPTRLKKSDGITPLPSRCVALGRAQGERTGHWLLIWNGRVMDPAAHFAPAEYAVCSYLPVEKE